MVRPAIRQAVDQPRGSRGRRRSPAGPLLKTSSNSASFNPCGCSVGGWSRHQVDDVDDAHRELRQVRRMRSTAARVSRRGHISGAGQDDVLGSATLVVLRPVPDAQAARAVGDRDRRQLPSSGRGSLPVGDPSYSGCVNREASRQEPGLSYLSMEDRIAHCTRGLGILGLGDATTEGVRRCQTLVWPAPEMCPRSRLCASRSAPCIALRPNRRSLEPDAAQPRPSTRTD